MSYEYNWRHETKRIELFLFRAILLLRDIIVTVLLTPFYGAAWLGGFVYETARLMIGSVIDGFRSGRKGVTYDHSVNKKGS